MQADLILFWVFAPISVASGVAMLLMRNAVHAALFLIVNFFCLAIFYLILGAPFLFAVQIIVYAGAIMVLFLFVIMLLGTELLPPSKALPWQRPMAFILAAVLAGEALYLLFFRKAVSGDIPQPVQTFGTPQAVGRALFNQYLLPFEITSVLLLIAMVGAIVLTKKEKGEQ